MADSQSSSTAAATPPHASAPNGEASTSEENAAVENGSQAGFRPPETRRVSITFGRTSWSPGADATAIHRDDKWSCFAVIFSFWFFVSVTLILGVYGSMIVVLGPESSIAFQPSPLFVQYVKVENLDAKPGPILYGTYQYPPLDVVATWGENRNVSLPSGSHKEWRYFLNRGSEVNISYRLIPESSSVFLVIAEGTEGLSVWLENPTQPNTTLSWNVIQGTGIITQKIFSSTSYYIALGNLDEEVEVELNLSVRAFLHNTTNAYYKCSLTSSPCSLNILFPNGNAAVLVSPGPQQARLSSYTRFKEIGLLINLKGDTSFNGQPNILNTSSNEWYVKLSYGPRWMTYIFGIGGLTLLLFWAFDYLNKLHCAHEDRAGVGSEGNGPQREPLLSRKDDDLSSWGSSYDSLSQDEEDLDFHTGDGETSNNTRRLCAICFDAPRDCFFLPCGHCAACFACGTRIAEAAGTCPVCRRNMKKVRKIFTV